MAAIDDLIAQVEDKALRERLRDEASRIAKKKTFGLVFEEHLPELTPIYSAEVRRHSKVALRKGPLTDLWRVISVRDGDARCRRISNGEVRSIQVEDLVVMRQFGDPIYPSLVPVDRVQNGPEGAAWHTLIEADNYHALQLLEYACAGKVDCIYIDPPYNSGARDWKYNNDFVDKKDRWRHSKWLAMMKRRLLLAKRLLIDEKGVLIVTVDEHEVHHLRALLAQIFPEFYIQMITAVINPKGVTQGRFSRVEEYAVYCFGKGAFVPDSSDNLLNIPDIGRRPRWKGLLRSGTNARRVDRKNMFYPVLIDQEKRMVVDAGDPLPFDQDPLPGEKINGYAAAWPIRTDKSFGNWGVSATALRRLIRKGYVSCGKYDEKRKTFGITYISELSQKRIKTGEITITGRDARTNVVKIEFASNKNRVIKTVWHRTRHDAGAYGSGFVQHVLGGTKFPFPKSIYSVKDALAAVIRHRKDALILDFFSGSGTTLNAVHLLNLEDNGRRQCIMVTNNEVSAEEAQELRVQGYRPGQAGWERRGICQSVTWRRSKFTILGKRDDGSELDGDYLTGQILEKERPRMIRQAAFTSTTGLNTLAKKRQLVALIDGIPQSLVKKNSAFIVSEEHSKSILFDDSQADAWLDALEHQEHITEFFVVTASKATFDSLKARILELLGAMFVLEEEKRPMREGFSANLEYFRLDFLDKDNVALGRQFPEILPILWLRAGAIGPRPELSQSKPIPAILLPDRNPFAVLVDETRFADFVDKLASHIFCNDLTHVFLVTDSEEAFQEMSGQLKVPNVIQLYRDYLENFVINKVNSALVKVELFDFQVDALAKLRARLAAARPFASSSDPQAISFSAPTGSGKTIVMTALFENIFFGEAQFEPQPEAAILWISDMPELNAQTRMKIESKSDRIRPRQLVTIDATFDAETLSGGHIYFMNTQKLGSEKLLTRKGDGRQFTIWETLTNTANSALGRFYIVIDEAHRGMRSDQALRKAQTILQRFLLGNEHRWFVQDAAGHWNFGYSTSF